jgi:hypothetical protein
MNDLMNPCCNGQKFSIDWCEFMYKIINNKKYYDFNKKSAMYRNIIINKLKYRNVRFQTWFFQMINQAIHINQKLEVPMLVSRQD